MTLTSSSLDGAAATATQAIRMKGPSSKDASIAPVVVSTDSDASGGASFDDADDTTLTRRHKDNGSSGATASHAATTQESVSNNNKNTHSTSMQQSLTTTSGHDFLDTNSHDTKALHENLDLRRGVTTTIKNKSSATTVPPSRRVSNEHEHLSGYAVGYGGPVPHHQALFRQEQEAAPSNNKTTSFARRVSNQHEATTAAHAMGGSNKETAVNDGGVVHLDSSHPGDVGIKTASNNNKTLSFARQVSSEHTTTSSSTTPAMDGSNKETTVNGGVASSKSNESMTAGQVCSKEHYPPRTNSTLVQAQVPLAAGGVQQEDDDDMSISTDDTSRASQENVPAKVPLAAAAAGTQHPLQEQEDDDMSISTDASRASSQDQESLAGMNGADYIAEPDVGGMFGFDNDDSSSSSDSSDDGFWQTQQRSGAVRSKSVIEDDGGLVVVESGTSIPAETAAQAVAASGRESTFKDKEEAQSPAAESVIQENGHNYKDKSPFYDTDDDDDSDFSLTAAPKGRLKKKKKKKAALLKDPVGTEIVVSSTNKTKTASRKKGAGVKQVVVIDDESSKPPKKLVASKSTGRSQTKATPASAALVVGQNIYAAWNTTEWYWGIVTEVKRKKSSSYDQYSILFDDGYSLNNVSRKRILSVDQFRECFHQEPPSEKCLDQGPAPPLDSQAATGTASLTSSTNSNSLSPREMYARRCGTCELCVKPDCGECATCIRNKGASSGSQREVCLQKMCLTFPDAQKKQQVPGILPPNWTFLFTTDRRYDSGNGKRARIPGLFLFPDGKTTFRSVEAAVVCVPKLKKNNANVVADFNRHIGVTKSSRTTTSSGQTGARASGIAITTTSSLALSKGKTPAKAKKKAKSAASLKPTAPPLSLEELLKVSCGDCLNCKKEDCGSCSSCLSNRTSRHKEVCIQKMCCRVKVARKAQPMPPTARFPDGWSFIIDETREGYSTNAGLAPQMEGAYGLKLFSPTGTEYYSVERAKGHQNSALKDVVVSAFYEHIGATKSRKRKSLPLPKSNLSAGDVEATSGLVVCGVCENCTKEACRKCAVCQSSTGGASKHCFQKMCCKWPVDAKAKQAVGFPLGWRFYFAEQPANRGSYAHKPVPGLYIQSAGGGKKYRSVEAAVSFFKWDSRSDIARKFYTHVGLTRTSLESVVRAVTQEDLTVGLADTVSGGGQSSTSTTGERSLSKYRVVGCRVYCQVGNQGRWGTITEKVETESNGYEFSVELEDDNSLLEDLDAGSVLSEFHYKKKTGMDPPPPPGYDGSGFEDDIDSAEEEAQAPPKKKQKFASAATVTTITSTDHFLVGQKFCFAWTDLKQQKKIVYGRVVECEMSGENHEVQSFRVKYSKKSRDLVNRMGNDCASVVPETQKLSASMVLGGCLRAEEDLSTGGQDSLLQQVGRRMHSWKWFTPDSYREDMVETSDGTRLPRLTLAVRGFQLTFTVKQSTIPNAGYGVFLSCTRLTMDDDDEPLQPFQLNPGELLDSGVYAPLRIEDKKSDSTFSISNFIHAHRCEEWAFDSGEPGYHLDITDDTTGDIHKEAKKHIYAYVNESNVDGAVCIRAEHDPEGSVHYLLGHAHRSDGSFVVPSDGTEVEVFVNYGEGYEKIRVRKGYSFFPAHRQHLLKVLKYEDVAEALEMDKEGAADVATNVEFMLALFSKEADFKQEVVRRALVCAAVFQRRARQIFLEGTGSNHANDDDDEASVDTASNVDTKKLLNLSGALVVLLLDKVQDEQDRLKMLQARGNVDGLLARVLEMQFSKRQLSKLALLME